MIKTGSQKRPRFRSLTVTLTISFLALILPVLFIASALWLSLNFRVQQKIIAEQQSITSEMAADTVKSFIGERLNLLKSTGSFTKLINASKEEQNITLARLLGIEPSFRQLVLLNAQGKELSRVSRLSQAASRELVGQISTDTIDMLKAGKNYISPIYIDDITSEPMVIMAVPVTNVLGDFQGILLSELNLKFMWDLVGSIKIGKKGQAYVVNKKGDLIAFVDISRVLAGENLMRLKEVREFVEHDPSTYFKRAKLSRGINGNLVISTHAHLWSPDWAAVVELPVSEAYESVFQGVFSAAVAFILSLILALVVGVYLSRRIATPIIGLRDAALKIGAGNLDTEIDIKRSDEIGDLADSFNKMVSDLKESTVSIDELKKEQRRFQDVAESTGDWIWETDAQGKYTYSSPVVERILGYKPEEMLGKYFYDFFHSDQKEDMKKEALNAFSRREPVRGLINRNLRKDGQVVILETNGVPLIGAKGELIGYRGVDRDITERKKAEEDSLRLLSLHEATLESTADGILVVDREGNVTSHNLKFLQLWRIPEELSREKNDRKLLAYVLEQLVDPDLFIREVQRLYAHPEEDSVDELFFKDGRTFERVSKPQRIGDKIVGRVWSFRDITERKKAEENLRKAEEIYRTLVENINMGITLIDKDCNIIMTNAAQGKMFNKDPRDFIGHKCYSEFEKRSDICIGCPGMDTVVSGKAAEAYRQGRREDGSIFDVHISTVPVFDKEGRPNGFIEVVEDITERKKAEEELKNAYEQLKEAQAQLVQSAKMASIGLLAGGVAHEINNPLTGVLNNVQLIKMIAEQKRNFSIEDFKDLLDLIEESAQRCTRITRSLLGFSRASKGIYQPLSLNEMIEKVIILIEHELRLQNISIETELAPDLPQISGDPQLIQQVVFDIVNNAKWAIQKKSEKNGGVITIKSNRGPNDSSLFMSISDNGVGIPQENIERVFEPFFTTKQVGEGTGLGLSIVYNIIKEHNGTISVESKPGEGTAFNISLPAARDGTNKP